MSIIFYRRKDNTSELVEKIMGMKINDVFNKLTRDAWKSNVQYKVIYKDKNVLKLILMSNRSTYLFMYEKIAKIKEDEVRAFITSVKELEVDKGYYIITGTIESDILTPSKIVLEDIIKFSKYQKNYNSISFYRYMP